MDKFCVIAIVFSILSSIVTIVLVVLSLFDFPINTDWIIISAIVSTIFYAIMQIDSIIIR